jgi:hypothetical protein
MNRNARAGALLPVWTLLGFAWLAAVLTFTAVHATRIGCVGARVADFIAVAGVAGLGLATASLLLVAAVPTYRTGPRTAAAAAPLALSAYAIVALLARNGAICG